MRSMFVTHLEKPEFRRCGLLHPAVTAAAAASCETLVTMLETLSDMPVWAPLVLALVALVVIPRLAAPEAAASPKLFPGMAHQPAGLRVYGPWYLPAFVRGILALYRLGADEDRFLLELRREHPVAVWVPWPMQQTFVLGSRAIDQVYKAQAKTLSFVSTVEPRRGTRDADARPSLLRSTRADSEPRANGQFPIRREMQRTAFGADYWDDRKLMDGQFFPVHARGMSKANLTAPLARFVATVREKVDELSARLDSAPTGGEGITLDLVEWTLDAFYDGTLAGFFGPKVLDARGTTKAELYAALEAYDRAFPIIASGLLPPALVERIADVKKARKAQHVLAATFSDWVAGGFDGLEHGVVRDMAQVALDNDLGAYEAGKMLVADFWASMANAPFIAVRLLIALLQAPPDLRRDLQSEIDAAMDPVLGDDKAEAPELSFAYLAEKLPLLGSCITETMRLETSALSIRVVEKEIVLSSDKSDTVHAEVVVPAHSRLVNVTRMHHLNDAAWEGNASEWDGRRFFDGDGTKSASAEEAEDPHWRSRRAREVYGFGGGISRVSRNPALRVFFRQPG